MCRSVFSVMSNLPSLNDHFIRQKSCQGLIETFTFFYNPTHQPNDPLQPAAHRYGWLIV